MEDPSLWKTEGKTYAQWICSLVHSLISHCDDIILRYLFSMRSSCCIFKCLYMLGQLSCQCYYIDVLYCSTFHCRLCQNIVLLKAEIAELLLAHVLVSIAGKVDSSPDLCQLISVKVNIFTCSSDLLIKRL